MISERVSRSNLNRHREAKVSCRLFFFLVYITLVLTQTPPTSEGPTFSEPISNVTVPVGREAVLACVVEDLSTYKNFVGGGGTRSKGLVYTVYVTALTQIQVAWLRVNTQTILTIANHVITKNHRIGVTHTDHRTWYLHIREVRQLDQGDYMCQINTDPMKSQVGYLEVVVPPDILDYPTSTDMVVREGSNVSLRCAATGSPAPNIIWRRESGELILIGNKEVANVEGPVFNITKVNRLHMGPYLCIASNGVPPTVSKRIMLVVHFPPMIWIQNQLVGAQIAQQITLECLSEAYPKSINYWTKENNDIISNGGKYQPVLVDNIYKVHMKLTIKGVNMADFQTYKCVSKNSLGGTDGGIKLYHIPTPTTPSTTTTTIIPTVTRVEKKQKTRQKPAPTVQPSSNEVAELQAATKSRDRGLQLRGPPKDEASNNEIAGGDNARERISSGIGSLGNSRSDNSAQSMSSNSVAIILTGKYSALLNVVTILFFLS